MTTKTLTFTTLTRGGAATMAKFYVEKMGAELVSAPAEMNDGTDRWTFTVTDTVS